MPMSLREKLRAVDAPRRPAQAAPAPASARDCWQDQRVLPLDSAPGAWALPIDTVRLMEPGTLPPQLTADKILYLDTETTGLSGGAGTVAFLVGVGWLTPAGFAVRQYLMRDYPEERYVLAHVAALLPRFDALCTFNGKSFDLPLLQSRLRMNRMDAACLDKPHVDLLHLARRVWKMRLGSCRLSSLEARVFGQARVDDLPGSEVPQRYFSYLKTGDFRLLEQVLAHNRQDIFSLCRLLTRMAAMYAAPELERYEQDVFSMGVALEKNRHIQQARRCYRLAARGLTRVSSRLRLAHSYRRAGEDADACALWQEMIRQGEGWIEPYVELAKYYEHRARNVGAALELTRQALALLAEPSLRPQEAVQNARDALQYRYARLKRKRDKQDAPGASHPGRGEMDHGVAGDD